MKKEFPRIVKTVIIEEINLDNSKDYYSYAIIELKKVLGFFPIRKKMWVHKHWSNFFMSETKGWPTTDVNELKRQSKICIEDWIASYKKSTVKKTVEFEI